MNARRGGPATLCRRLIGAGMRRFARALDLAKSNTGPQALQVFVARLEDRKVVPGAIRRLSGEGRMWQSMINAAGTAVVYWGVEPHAPGHHLWVASLDDARPTRLTSGESVNGHPFWFPDGRRVAFFSSEGASAGTDWHPGRQFDPDRPSTNLHILDADSGERQQLTEGASVDERPAVSPDGTEIAFVSSRSGSLDIWRIGADGSGLRQVTETPTFAYRPVFSPDGTRIAYFTKAADGSHQIAIAAWPSGEAVPYRQHRRFIWAHGPFWAADGQTMLIHGQVEDMPEPALWAVTLESGAAEPITVPGFESCSHGTWDEAERWLAFDSRQLV